MTKRESHPERPNLPASGNALSQSNSLRSLLARWLDFLYPPACLLCRVPLQKGRYLCQSCCEDLPRIKQPYCMKCGDSIEGLVPDDVVCTRCRGVDYFFDFARSVTSAEGPANEIMHAYKYGRQIHLHRELALLMEELWNDPRLSVQKNPPWVVVPVPLHWRRERWRWFNQSYEIAKTLAQQCNLSCQKALRRTRNTSQQALLDRGHRLANLQGAFQLSPREQRLETTRDKPVLLIDDVFTTGSTAEECARVLKEEGGAEKVVVLTVLRG